MLYTTEEHHFPCEYYGLVIKYTKSHHPNWCIKVSNTPQDCLVGGGSSYFFYNQTLLGLQLVMFALTVKTFTLKKLYCPFFMEGVEFCCVSRLQSHCEETVYILTIGSPWLPGTSLGWKDERLSWPSSYPVVLNLGFSCIENPRPLPPGYCSVVRLTRLLFIWANIVQFQ